MGGSGNWQFSLSIDPSPRVLASMYRAAAESLQDFRPVWRRLAPELARGIGENLSSRGSAIGERWPRPHKKYQARKVLEGFESAPLERTGEYVGKLTSPSSVVSMSPLHLSFGLQGKLAKRGAALHFGSKKNARPHPHMGWNRGMQAKATSLLDDHVNTALRAAAQRMRGS